MFPERTSKIPQYLAVVAIAIYAVNNPQSAAELVNKIVGAIITFSNSLGG
ncbi:hypothetical protein Acsp03_27550 [Actinomadura sp. NBRC 104412]|nr:hypothetical protein [Actinomadura sp. NBRC 104412]GLZ05289.1 hypothetical protein Acsp03_27550 [Actinomadura sp. NBRC 104412]